MDHLSKNGRQMSLLTSFGYRKNGLRKSSPKITVLSTEKEMGDSYEDRSQAHADGGRVEPAYMTQGK